MVEDVTARDRSTEERRRLRAMVAALEGLPNGEALMMATEFVALQIACRAVDQPALAQVLATTIGRQLPERVETMLAGIRLHQAETKGEA